MADWPNITDVAVDPDAPVTSNLMYGLRDAPIAIAEGAAGAPRIQFGAMGSFYSSTGQIGSVAFLGASSTDLASANPGDIVSGSLLRYAGLSTDSAGATRVVLAGSPPGTWKCMGFIAPFGGASGSTNNATLFMRMS